MRIISSKKLAQNQNFFLWMMVVLTMAAIAGVWAYVTKAELSRISEQRSLEADLIGKVKQEFKEIKTAPRRQAQDATTLKTKMRAILEAQAAERATIEALKAKIEIYDKTTNP